MAKTETKATPSPEELLKTREDALVANEATIAEREDAVTAREVAVIEKEETLKARELALEENSTPEESIDEFDFEDEKYAFAKNAPQSIRFGGQVFTRKQLIENEEVLLQIIGGNSPLIKKL